MNDRDVRGERGQASIEWVGLILLAAIAFGGLLMAVPGVDGRSLGGTLAHRIACGATGDCAGADDALVRAYGRSDALLLRRHLPGLVYEPGERQLPVDWRRCRAVECAAAPLDRDLDAHRTDAGLAATVFTHVLHRDGRRYLQYWLYYPDSNTTWAGSDWIWRHSPHLQRLGEIFTGSAGYPGFHRDDWEGVQVVVGRDGRASMRVTSHGHWQWCKFRGCDRWGPVTGWSRVSRGSHSGHVPTFDGVRPQLPGRDLHERTSTADGIRLVPLEGVDRRGYRRLDPDISPPWLKDAYANPESSES